MVRFLVKLGSESLFLYETSIDTLMFKVYEDMTTVFNNRIKINNLCYEVEELSKHGPSLPPDMQGLAPGQAEALGLQDDWAEKCEASGGYDNNPDPLGRRNGRRPSETMRNVLLRAVEEAKTAVAKAQVDAGEVVSVSTICRALHQLRGATFVVYPMGLPPNDPATISLSECDHPESCEPSQRDMICDVALWFCGRQLPREGKLSSALNTSNDKTRVTVKITSSGQGPPAREPAMDEKERNALMAHYHRKQLELEFFWL